MSPHDDRPGGHNRHQRLIDGLRRQADDIRRMTSGLSHEQLATRTVPGKWSLTELVCHLWRVQRLFQGRIEGMLDHDNPPITSYEPEGDPEFAALVESQTAESALRGLAEERERLVARLEALPPASWHRPGQHAEFPHYDVHFQVEYMLHHEAHHLYQMFQRRAMLAKAPH